MVIEIYELGQGFTRYNFLIGTTNYYVCYDLQGYLIRQRIGYFQAI